MVKTDLFLTHDWGRDENGRKNHDRVSFVNDSLKELGFTTWFDSDRMSGDIIQQMSDGIENTKSVIVFLTQRYMEKVTGDEPMDNCKLEFMHAARNLTTNKLVCIVMENRMKATANWKGAIGMYLAGKIYIDMSGDFTNPDYIKGKLNLLQNELLAMGIVPNPSAATDDLPLPKKLAEVRISKEPTAERIFLGDFECHIYDGSKNKNDWHYVEISYNPSENNYTWKNRAGAQWTLYPTGERNKLRVGDDCPYSDTHKIADFSEKGVHGPHRELYLRADPSFLRKDIEMKSDGTMTAEACIVVPEVVKRKGGRVGNIFGNHANPVGDPSINFELHGNGQLRLFWNTGEVDIYGKTDLRDGFKHIVRFERTRSETKLFVDGKLEASGKGGTDVPKRILGTFVGCDWREGGMAFRGDIESLKVNNTVEVKRIRLRDDIEPKSDRSMNAEARILVPTAVKKKGGRVGVIFGNHQNPVGDPEINLEIHAGGELRLYWDGGKVDLRGTRDLRDGIEHVVAFQRTTTYTKLFVDGKEEAAGPAGPDVSKRMLGTFVGCDWREGGMGFRGEIISLEINNK